MQEFDSYLDIQNETGEVERHYPFTRMENVIGLEKLNVGATEQITDWTVKEKSALSLLAANSYIIDDVTGATYKIGSSDGKFYFEPSDVSVKDIVDTIVVALTPEEDATPTE